MVELHQQRLVLMPDCFATLRRLEDGKAAPVQSFAVIVRKTALCNSLRQAGPG